MNTTQQKNQPQNQQKTQLSSKQNQTTAKQAQAQKTNQKDPAKSK